MSISKIFDNIFESKKDDIYEALGISYDMLVDSPNKNNNRMYSKKFSPLELMFWSKYIIEYNYLLYNNEYIDYDSCYQNIEEYGNGHITKIMLRPQKKIGKYRVDFYINKIYCKIAIELDGFKYHDRNKEQFQYERERQNYLVSKGITVFRYTWDQVSNNFSDVYHEIMTYIKTKGEQYYGDK
jgi:very-short-patch-repair endonuclease